MRLFLCDFFGFFPQIPILIGSVSFQRNILQVMYKKHENDVFFLMFIVTKFIFSAIVFFGLLIYN